MMPLWKMHSLEEAERHLSHRGRDPETCLRTSLTLTRIAHQARRGVRTAQRGLVFYRSLAEGEADRQRYATEQLRRAGADGADRRRRT